MTEYGRSARVEWASSIRPKRQVWLWENKIPVGAASALAGRGGTGKTTYVLHMVAQLSLGLLPGKYYGDPRPSLIWSGEDAWDKVLVPRLIAAGADLSMVGRLAIESTVDSETREVTPKLPLDTSAVSDMITSTGAVLAFIDPIASTMSGDLHREADVRAAVDALARVADATDAVMMFVRHFGKGGGNASDKMSGSHAFRDAVRSVFLFAEDGDRVIVSQDKGNYAPKGEESFAFRLESVTVPTDDGPTDVARVVDLGASETSVGDVINRTEVGHDSDAQDVDRWLADLLANGSVKATEVFTAADAAGYSKDQAKRAKKRLGVVAERPTNPGPWFWSLPSKHEAESTEQGAPTRVLPALPALPVRSEGVEQGADGGREQSARECSLPSTDDTTAPPTPLTARKQELRQRRTIRVRGKEVPRCYICGKAVMAGQGDVHLSCLSKQEAAS
ncbi:AAA family ATPase [Mycolicibacterium mageritense]|uniref:AAA family ATPase n=1 Tax=Mycolicibacterium mageritense TaxID=53462 RepID=UPI0023F3FFA8|nr:AAA family ATPase [Mycolicibacterium mageritense]